MKKSAADVWEDLRNQVDFLAEAGGGFELVHHQLVGFPDSVQLDALDDLAHLDDSRVDNIGFLPYDGIRYVMYGLCLLGDPATRVARFLSFWGDYWTGTFIVSALLGAAGFAMRRRRWQVAA
ncbi:MAG: hypothetical protein HGA94_05410, partial [Candidatus Aminicenantes bacterium]|nr:hypothetical protein [Candidatus Aminicenantes bacterium]